MPVDIPTLRKMVEADESDTVMRYVLGQKLLEEDGGSEALREAREHLVFVKENDPRNAAALLTLAKVLEALQETDAALLVIDEAIQRIDRSPDIDGTDLKPELEALKESLT